MAYVKRTYFDARVTRHVCPEFLLTHQTTKVFKTFVVSSLYQQNFRPPTILERLDAACGLR